MHLTISSFDAAVICVYLGVVVLLGVWTGRGNRDLSDYLLGSRNLPWWALLGSIVATETSTATFLSVPGLAYAVEGDLRQGDMRFLQLAVGYIIGRILVARFLLPAYFAGEMFTAYEVLHRRFGVAAQRLASILFLVGRNLGDGLRLFLTALALQAATSLPLVYCIAVIAAVTIFYTLFGGMKSVVWNDCLQLLVYLVGGVVTLWLIADQLPGGWEQIRSFAGEHGKFRVIDLSWNPRDAYTFWAGLFGGAGLSLGTHGTDQMFVQRLLSARNQREAARALVLSGFVVLLQFALFLLIGVGLAAFFTQYPPSDGELIDKGDAAYASYIAYHMPSGLAGVTLAAVFASAMSTLSSSLNSSAAAMAGDFGGADDGDSQSAHRRLARTRVLTVVFGVIQAGLALGAALVSESVVNDALAIASFIAGPMLGVFALGVFTRKTDTRTAVCGMCTGLAVLAVVRFQTDVAWPWYALIGSTTTFAVGWTLAWVHSLTTHRSP
jgi:SSS family transporter